MYQCFFSQIRKLMLKTQVTQLISGIAGTRTQSQHATHRGKFGKYFDACEVL